MVSVSSRCVWCVEWRWCVSLSRTVQWCGPRLVHPSAVLIGIAVVSCTVLCRVCGVWWCVFVCGVRVAGYPLSATPSSW